MTTTPTPDLGARATAAGDAHFASLASAGLALWQAASAIVQATTRVATEHEAVLAALDFSLMPTFDESLAELDRVTTPETIAIVAAALGQAWDQYAGELVQVESALAAVIAIVHAARDDAERLRDGRYGEVIA